MLTMCGWRSLPASAASFWKKRSWRRASSGSAESFSSTLMATSRWPNGSAARYTEPVAPLPRSCFTSYLPTRESTLGGWDVASEAIVQVEHSAAPDVEWVRIVKDHLRARDARPLQNREQNVVTVRRIGAADKLLALQHRLHPLERAL